MTSKVTYRQQFTRCGKQRCRKCKEGAGHGPYWYAYWSENGRTVSKYIGIQPPEDAQIEAEMPSSLAVTNQGAMQVSTSEPLDKSLTRSNTDGTENNVQTLTPGAGNSESGQILRIYLLGQFRVERRSGDSWQTVTNRTWHRRRARALLGLLLSNPGRRLGREQAMDALWPDLDIETAANRLNGAVHEVRQILEPEITRPAASRLLRLERDVLILADASLIWVDAEAFENLLNKANLATDPEQVEQMLEEAARLYGGDYLLEELYSEWVTPRREALRRGWMGLLLRLADLRATRGALTSAIEPLDRLLATDPTHETAVRRLMVLLTQLDRRGEALRAYKRLATILKRDYETDPLPETTELYDALRKGTFQVPQSPSLPVSAPKPAEKSQATSSNAAGTGEKHFQPIPRPVLQLSRHKLSKLVGRERELAVMQQFLRDIEQPALDKSSGQQESPSNGALQGKRGQSTGVRKQKVPHILLLTGESGIGKTRLAEELSQEADSHGWSVVWAHAYEQEATIAYRTWTEILRMLLKHVPKDYLLAKFEDQSSGNGEETSSSSANAKLARLSTLLPELATYDTAQSQVLSSSILPPEQERLHLWETTLGILRALSDSTPLLLVFDDLHWSDDSSIDLLAYLVRHMQNERIAFVATCRDVELSPTSGLRTLINDLRREQALVSLSIQPLNEEQIGSLVSHLPKPIVRSIQTQAGGNPFFAEELARVSETLGLSSMQNAPLLPPEADSLTTPPGRLAPMPETIAAVLDRRLSKLSQECQSLLGKLAVLGGSFEFRQVSFMAGDAHLSEDTILDLLEEALAAGLLTEEETGTTISYHFWHPLIVSHLYEKLSAARRTQLHRRAAHTLIQEYQGKEAEGAAVITHHLSKGGGDPVQLAKYAQIAGNRAYTLSAYTEAEYYYRLASDALTRGLTPGEKVRDPLHLASLLERLAECHLVHGTYDEMRHLYQRALELRGQHVKDMASFQDEQQAQQWRQLEAQRQGLIWREIGRAWAETGDFTEASQCYQHGMKVLADAGVESGPAWACLHLQQGNIHWRLGNIEDALRYAQEALEMLEQSIQNTTSSYRHPHLTENELPTRTSLSVIGDSLEIGRCHEILGVIAATRGQYDEALNHLRQAQAIFEQEGHIMAITLVIGNLGAVHAMKAENEIARKYFHRALELAERTGDIPNMAFVTGNLGDVAARCGDLQEAEEWFRQSLALAERINDREQMTWSYGVLASILQDEGQMHSALVCARKALSLGRAMKSARWIAFALIALADWRIAEAVAECKVDFIDPENQHTTQIGPCNGLIRRAQAALERALALEGLDVEVTIEGQVALGVVHLLLGELEQAREITLRSMEEAQKYGINRVLARSQRALGRILAAQGQWEKADAYFEQALEIFSRYGMRLDYARALHGYGVTLLKRGEKCEQSYLRGIIYLSEARDLFKQCQATIDLEWVERILAHSNAEYKDENLRKAAT